MNKQKFLEDRMNALNFQERVTDSLFQGIACEACGAIHGTTLAGGGKVILSVVGNKILCYPHGIAHAETIGRKPMGQRRSVDLESFGLKQEILL